MDRSISVIGLGYVGLPLAVAFAQKTKVMAFDINEKRISSLKKYHDSTLEVDSSELKEANIIFTTRPQDLQEANFHIICVPTPINKANQPNLEPLKNASKTLGSILKEGDIVVYESTVYPGATEEICIPILEEYSNLESDRDFFVGYSPERINPGDKLHTLSQIKKVVSAQSQKTLNTVSSVYQSIIAAGIYKASSIKVAEAAKVIENTQRDINIAFVNELKILFDKMNINTHEVLEAASTKWNFLSFKPGLVGGHCIGVDPYYLTYKAQKLDYYPEMILAGRRINNGMGKYVAEQTVKKILQKNKSLNLVKLGILGFTFKENCPDIRNTKVVDIISELKSYNITPFVYDPIANKQEVLEEYNIELVDLEDLQNVNVMIIAVGHNNFKTQEFINFISKCETVIDFKNITKEYLT